MHMDFEKKTYFQSLPVGKWRNYVICTTQAQAYKIQDAVTAKSNDL